MVHVFDGAETAAPPEADSGAGGPVGRLLAFVNSADEVKLEFALPEQLARRDALAAQLASLTAERTVYAEKVAAESRSAIERAGHPGVQHL